MMKKLRLYLLAITLLFISVMRINAQNTVTVSATGTTGSYKTGTVTSAGTLTDGALTVSNASGTAPRGWAVFNLSALNIPAGANISGITLSFNKTGVTGTGNPSHSIVAIDTNIATLATANLGSVVYSLLGSGTTTNTATWTPGTATGVKILNLNAAGISFISSRLQKTITLGWAISSSSRVYNITGYGGTAATIPTLTISYTPYCIPALSDFGCSDGDEINTFQLPGANSTGINNVATGCTSNLYSYDNRTTTD